MAETKKDHVKDYNAAIDSALRALDALVKQAAPGESIIFIQPNRRKGTLGNVKFGPPRTVVLIQPGEIPLGAGSAFLHKIETVKPNTSGGK